MKKTSITIITILMSLWFVNLVLAGELEDKFFNPNPTLTKEEREAIAKAMRHSTREYRVKPTTGPDGSVRYLYGAQIPSIVCSPLQVTDIELQPGETFRGIHMGDNVRWRADPAVTGSGGNEVLHIILKPVDVGLETSMVFLTDRRVYHFKLKSHRTEYMPKVSFAYADEALAEWDAVKKTEVTARQQKTTKEGVYIGSLDFEYDVSGDAPWKPVRVYNDGQKTIIEMPQEMKQTEAPALLVTRKKAGVFKSDELAVVNYRIHDNRYIVDNLFNSAILVAGVGGDQERITISRRKPL